MKDWVTSKKKLNALANPANGGLEYVAGCHRWGKMFGPALPKNHQIDLPKEKFEEIPDFDAKRDQYEFLSWDMEPGDMLIHHGLTVHEAGRNTLLDTSRCAYTPRFVGEQTYWEPAHHDGSMPGTERLVKRDPLDRHGAFPVVFDVDAFVPDRD